MNMVTRIIAMILFAMIALCLVYVTFVSGMMGRDGLSGGCAAGAFVCGVVLFLLATWSEEPKEDE